MVYYDGFAKRLSELRQEKDISARDMSLSLGQNESYINKIENNYALPSMNGFFYICEFLGITPAEFFDEDTPKPILVKELTEASKKLNDEQLRSLIEFIKKL